jgi:hypothetical protein
MAISINQVYQTVLYVLNKEQRGYIPPAEFNTLAEQAQLTIFEKYFDDLNQALRMAPNDSEYANRVKTNQEKIDVFEEEKIMPSLNKLSDLSPALHRLGTIEYNQLGSLPVESKLTSPSKTFPAFSIRANVVYPVPSDILNTELTVYYVRKPNAPVWNYSLGSIGNYIFNLTTATSNPSVDFEISDIDQVQLINTILIYCGVIIRDNQITQTAMGLVAQENQNEKS